MTKIQKQFIAATEVPDVVTEVALARQVFVKRLLGSSMDLDDTLDLIAELAGERPTAENRDAITWEVYCNHTSAARRGGRAIDE